MNNKEMKEFFDALAADWNNCPDEYEKREKIVSLANFDQNSVIADIGCGRGVMLPHLMKVSPKEIIAIDLSSEMIKYAKSTFGVNKITYLNEDLLAADLQTLDAAIVYNAYPHFPDKQAFAEKLFKHLKKDGIFIIAHGRGKSSINGTHSGKAVSKISVPLEEAEKEAKKFEQFFTLQKFIDNEDCYFIKFSRK